jgi:iron-sulfur cluster repair protein YtfE (RIC family)
MYSSKSDPGARLSVPDISSALIRDLVERYPETMPVLASYGLDLCCGGGHTVADAAALHGEDADRMVAELSDAIERGRS